MNQETHIEAISARQLPRNLAMNIVSFVFNLIVGILLVPYLIKYLGIAAYGIVPLAMIFIEYISLITNSFNSVVSRFLTMEMHKNNTNEALIIFNTSFVVINVFCFIQIIVCYFILNNLNAIISIPNGMLNDAIWLFGLTFVGFILSMISVVFSVSMFSKNRLDLIKINEIIRLFVRITVLVSLFSAFEAKLIYVGVGNLSGGLTILLLSLWRWRQLTPELKIEITKIDFKKIRPIASMSWWVIINTIGYLLFLRIDTYIVNRFLGPVASGEYAAVLQWNQLIRTAAGMLAGALTPLGMIYYARGENEKLVRLMTMAVKVLGLALAVPLGLLCTFSTEILSFWLGAEYGKLGALMIIQICTLSINLGVLPLFAVQTALQRVKVPALLTCLMGAINLVLAVFFVSRAGWGYYGVAVAGVIVLTLKNAFFTPLYAAYILKLPKITFFIPLFHGGIAFVISFFLASILKLIINVESFAEIFIVAVTFSMISFLPILLAGLTTEEKKLIVVVIPESMKKVFKKVLFVS